MNCKVIYTGSFRFPNLDAAATRVQQIGSCLMSDGYDLEYLSWADGSPNKVLKYKGYLYRNMGEFRVKKNNVISRFFGFLFRGYKTTYWLCKNIKKNKIKLVIMYNPPSIFSLSVYILSFIFKFKVVLDVTEWYESEHLVGGKYGPAALENYIRMRLVYKLFNNIICISDFLQNYYSSAINTNSIIVPALSEIYNLRSSEITPLNKISLIYAGNAGRKDKLKEILLSLEQLNLNLKFNVVLNLYGPTVLDINNILTKEEMLLVSDYVFIHGNVPQSEVINAYSKATFSVLFRENKRYAKAGFPTKAAESWASGVPIITNAVGDLKKYCHDDNSIVVLDDMAKSIQNAIIDFDTNRLINMRNSSYSTAINNFTVAAHRENIIAFFNKVLQ